MRRSTVITWPPSKKSGNTQNGSEEKKKRHEKFQKFQRAGLSRMEATDTMSFRRNVQRPPPGMGAFHGASSGVFSASSSKTSTSTGVSASSSSAPGAGPAPGVNRTFIPHAAGGRSRCASRDDKGDEDDDDYARFCAQSGDQEEYLRAQERVFTTAAIFLPKAFVSDHNVFKWVTGGTTIASGGTLYYRSVGTGHCSDYSPNDKTPGPMVHHVNSKLN